MSCMFSPMGAAIVSEAGCVAVEVDRVWLTSTVANAVAAPEEPVQVWMTLAPRSVLSRTVQHYGQMTAGLNHRVATAAPPKSGTLVPIATFASATSEQAMRLTAISL
jgi:hypothetical protein